MGMSDTIARFILEMLEESGGSAEMQRAALAQRFSCVPSQINYVISTRFSPESGYIVESRRGGGGYIRITRVETGRQQLLADAVRSAGEQLDLTMAAAFLANAVRTGALSANQAALILAAISDAALHAVPVPLKAAVRADVFKQMLMRILDQ